jgi:triphosphoribosyl-dephospho-CoA synthase
MKPSRIAQCAQLAMLIELSSTPKPGNVDRCHDYGDLGFHHFLVSAVSAYPFFERAASGDAGVGRLLLEAVRSWGEWNLMGNTHFGSLALLMPLAAAAGRPGHLPDELGRVLDSTTVEDAIDFYDAFELAGARVAEVDEFSLKDPEAQKELRRQGRTLLDLMRLSQGHDLIAREWSTCYRRSFQLSSILERRVSRLGINDGVVLTYLEALSQEPDSLVLAKFGQERARRVSLQAGEALKDESLALAKALDRELLLEDVNPGSTADIIASSLFIALLRGLRF